ncbi:MAG: hypothetical protein ACFFAO_18970 [Candidatus Hermodarchaeota archaeon]
MTIIELGSIIGIIVAFIGFNATLVWRGLKELDIARKEISSRRLKFGKLVIIWSLLHILGFAIPLIIRLVMYYSINDFHVLLNNISIFTIGFLIISSIILLVYYIHFIIKKV